MRVDFSFFGFRIALDLEGKSESADGAPGVLAMLLILSLIFVAPDVGVGEGEDGGGAVVSLSFRAGR